MQVRCDSCDKMVEAAEGWDGGGFTCPSCEGPAVWTRQKDEVLSRPPEGATKRCPFCSELVLAVAKKCKHCHEFLDPGAAEQQHLRGQQRAAARDDKLESWWLTIIWASVIIPFIGNWVIVMVSSVMYYSWRNEYPNKANAINRHGWLAFLVGHVIWLPIYCATQFAGEGL